MYYEFVARVTSALLDIRRVGWRAAQVPLLISPVELAMADVVYVFCSSSVDGNFSLTAPTTSIHGTSTSKQHCLFLNDLSQLILGRPS